MEDRSWMPTLSIDVVRERAALLKRIRDFFNERDVMEVETPILSYTTNPAPHLASLSTQVFLPGKGSTTFYLQTSPEFHMKRLLAAGSGPIYQISKAFRDGEVGQLHNPEFTLLEWYRPHFSLHDLMDEADALLQFVGELPQAIRMTYADIFYEILQINVDTASSEILLAALQAQDHQITGDLTRDTLLELCLDYLILPHFLNKGPLFIYDFPLSQAQLAVIDDQSPPRAARFEIYIDGIELANAFNELRCPDEQQKRFEEDIAARNAQGLSAPPLDNYLLKAISLMPQTSGIALGIDRLHRIINRNPAFSPFTTFSILRS